MKTDFLKGFALAAVAGLAIIVIASRHDSIAREVTPPAPSTAPAAKTAPALPDPSTAIPDTLTVIHSRKSVRHFTGAPVSKDALTTLVKAGMAAPTAVNKQPWAFVVVTDRKKMDTLAANLPYAKMLSTAGAAIIVCVIPEKAFEGSTEMAILDGSCASENILLAAEASGLGALWTAVWPDAKRMEAVRAAAGIPANVIPLNVIPVGHPTGEDQPKDKFKAENIHWDQW